MHADIVFHIMSALFLVGYVIAVTFQNVKIIYERGIDVCQKRINKAIKAYLPQVLC